MELKVSGQWARTSRREAAAIPAHDRLASMLVALLIATIGVVPALPGAAGAEDGEDDLFEMSLDDLGSLDIEVTSVSKKAQNMAAAPTAIAVITAEEIRRSGATNIPEALRLVPGVQVARIDANRWAITARGFNGEFADKLLVLIDGRSVYTPLFGGVYWDVQDTLMADIARIEVIRGPGATVWGANAVNGVINIITKHAKKTHGVHAEGLYGNIDAEGNFRWGGAVGEDIHYRVYGKYKETDSFFNVTGPINNDGWNQGRAGMRMDWQIDDANSLTFQGDYYRGATNRGATAEFLTGEIVPIGGGFSTFATTELSDQAELQGGNVLARYSHDVNEDVNATLQFYYDRTDRLSNSLSEERDTIDIDFQNNFSFPGGFDWIWGLGYRWTEGRTTPLNQFNILVDPADRADDLFTAFLQGDWHIIEDKLTLTAGSKFERNNYTGFEAQPSVRVAFTPNQTHTMWASWSRAVHTPTVVDDDLRLPAANVPGPGTFGPVPVQLAIAGSNGAHVSEVLMAIEAGYRFVTDDFSLDIAAFANNYDNVRQFQDPNDPGGPAGGALPCPPPRTAFECGILLYPFLNGLKGWAYGTEILLTVKVHERARISTYYNYLTFDVEPKFTDPVLSFNDPGGSSPEHQWHVRGSFDLPFEVQFDALVWYMSELVGSTGTGGTGAVPDYWRVDLRLGWRPVEWLDLTVVGQNLNHYEHTEISAGLGSTAKIPRTFYGKATIHF